MNQSKNITMYAALIYAFYDAFINYMAIYHEEYDKIIKFLFLVFFNSDTNSKSAPYK